MIKELLKFCKHQFASAIFEMARNNVLWSLSLFDQGPSEYRREKGSLSYKYYVKIDSSKSNQISLSRAGILSPVYECGPLIAFLQNLGDWRDWHLPLKIWKLLMICLRNDLSVTSLSMS